jgi:2-polyprenyl-3-methyl-5-hydroxy-6-metoxy-1,4-benzoquinol methylase
MPDLSIRVFDAEIMDDLYLPYNEIAPVLEGLGKVNSWFGGHNSIIDSLKKFPLHNGYSVSDWGCGGGDMLIAIANWAKHQQIHLKLTGIDAAPAAINFAGKASKGFNNISYVQADVIKDIHLLGKHDIIISSLFTHHFDHTHACICRQRHHYYRSAPALVIILRGYSNNPCFNPQQNGTL